MRAMHHGQASQGTLPNLRAGQHRSTGAPAHGPVWANANAFPRRTQVCGPLLDDYSKMSFVRILSSKSETTSAVREVIRLLENQTGSRVRAIRTDNGSEYVNAELAQYLRSKGIVHQTTVPYNPEQNGAAERLNRTLMERARAMINDAGLPKELWAEAVNTANYIRCR